MNILEITNLTKLFKNHKGIEGINFKLKKGTITGFVGDNGMGKTTTIKTILGEYAKQSGEILFNGKELDGNDIKKIGFFPDQSSFPRDITIQQYCEYFLGLKDIDYKSVDTEIKTLLVNFGLLDYWKKPISTLSSGMVKKALIIPIIFSGCELIFFDEPTSNLDVNSRIDFMNIINEFKNKGKTILVTSHIIDELQHYIDNLMIIKDGKLEYCEEFNKQTQTIQKIYNDVYSKVDRKGIDIASIIK